ncbi:hypothetical protein BU24DRAFT_418347 [Aaosphaeria arxii CBS 175.79]|uniref:Transcription factor domain-containing protein n=1 Tax=Aaosphaeria arxii CBS 175.79 TaxID=1450172 RepID=A0A6A5XZZ7_9PLEO|nr:uncharacterized protein BU24DRAFT_418347 [Aaosphaeria arxii CBS 175.79]KAF2018792.1 hypothetical protein BU24DRAFT_418347 [Aaosphaeria arxii CBS 175.79]
MKCSGGPEACNRCAKAGCQCVFEPASAIRVSDPQSQSHFPLARPAPSIEAETRIPQTIAPLQRSLAKRRRLNSHEASTTPLSHHLSSGTPYSAVQHLELHENSEEEASVSTPNVSPTESRASSSCLLTWLCEAGIPVHEAEQMFRHFKLRIAPFIPALYDADFSRLPSSPIFGLATLQAVARYLPDSARLRSMLWSQLRRRLQDLIFEMPDRTSLRSIETMQGLIVLYACCEAAGPGVHLGETFGPDILTARSIAEGYALKMGLGRWSDGAPPDARFCVWWLWLYNMGHYTYMLYGCAKTMVTTPEIVKAKSYLDRTATESCIKGMLGEVELCMIWGKVHSQGGKVSKKLEDMFRSWSDDWDHLLCKAEGRHLLFHMRFARFRLHMLLTSPSEDSDQHAAASFQVHAAQTFVQTVTQASPISKDRLRYMCDFGFVMVAYACLFILKAANADAFYDRRPELIKDVEAAASLLQSFGTNNTIRPAIYGYTLQKLCAEGGIRMSGSATLSIQRPEPTILNQISAKEINSASTYNSATFDESQIMPYFGTESPILTDVDAGTGTDPNYEYLPIHDAPPDTLHNFAEFWGFNPNMFMFGGTSLENAFSDKI